MPGCAKLKRWELARQNIRNWALARRRPVPDIVRELDVCFVAYRDHRTPAASGPLSAIVVDGFGSVAQNIRLITRRGWK